MLPSAPRHLVLIPGLLRAHWRRSEVSRRWVRRWSDESVRSLRIAVGHWRVSLVVPR